MQIALRILAAAALLFMLVPVGLYCMGLVQQPAVKTAMTAGTVLWFVAVLPLRFRRGTAP